MRQILAALVIMLAVGCKDKEAIEIPSRNDVTYQDLKNSVVDYDTPLVLDLNKDGTGDFHLVSVFVYNNSNDQLEFKAISTNENMIYTDYLTPKVFNKHDTISANNSLAFSWNRYNPILITRIFTIDPANNYWEGEWKDKTEKYLGVKVKSNGGFHTGWIRISYSPHSSRIIVHDAALSKKAEADIIAGIH